MHSSYNLSEKERDLLGFAEAAGVSMNPRILRYIQHLVNNPYT